MKNEPNFEGEKMKIPSEDIASREDYSSTAKSSKVFILVLLLIILAVVTAGALFWHKNTPVLPPAEKGVVTEAPEIESETNETVPTTTTPSFNSSNALSSIEEDLRATQLPSPEPELIQIDAEIEGAVRE